ncbi:MAG: TlpA family protein disulfide reductase [Brevundimonas sp.]|jgi:thiol-disulfide isomerase/thioredoxin|uniref:TlpA family protein disulfide reductase n=1 Tax=Brevundimonas sp. TaxID=1871086 RepID=UPI00391CD523
MAETSGSGGGPQTDEPKARSPLGWLVVLLVAAGLLAVTTLGVLYAMRLGPFQQQVEATAGQSALSRYATGSIASLNTPAEPEPIIAYTFQDRAGEPVDFSAFQGQITVVNLWAMWCAPCRIEMPTLAALQRHYDPAVLKVVAINVDTGEDAISNARSFLDVNEPLEFYSDPTFRLPFELPGGQLMPQTYVLDRQGRIVAWKAGEADWSSPEARALFDALIADGS